jgi:hypothetical protein
MPPIVAVMSKDVLKWDVFEDAEALNQYIKKNGIKAYMSMESGDVCKISGLEIGFKFAPKEYAIEVKKFTV